PKDGKPALGAKLINLADLHQDQPISVIVYSDGKELVLLRAIASGARLSGKDLAIFVEKLGGKAKRVPWPKDRVAYHVDLRGTKVTDDDLLPLGQMKGLDSLDLSFTAVTDKGIAHLAGSAELASVELIGTRVTNAAIPHLRKIPKLHEV